VEADHSISKLDIRLLHWQITVKQAMLFKIIMLFKIFINIYNNNVI